MGGPSAGAMAQIGVGAGLDLAGVWVEEKSDRPLDVSKELVRTPACGFGDPYPTRDGVGVGTFDTIVELVEAGAVRWRAPAPQRLVVREGKEVGWRDCPAGPVLALEDDWLAAPDARGHLVARRECPAQIRWRRTPLCEEHVIDGPDGLQACVWRDEATVVEAGRRRGR